ncbi:uncharacterized protein LOC134853370 isoform X2 [Symsagittifera roscoffensis]|uniref:uncharacterized protein LOC134853370 isoform X2 n=1 Tax=Symsagittifera roscoffensis TaxID=84072 RepID=UPI00307B9141
MLPRAEMRSNRTGSDAVDSWTSGSGSKIGSCVLVDELCLYELLHAMRDTLVLNELFDMTVAYEEFRGMNEDFTLGRLFFQGPVQKKYHIHLEKHDAIPLSEYSELELRDWLFEVFEEKERRLEFFESNEPPCLDFGNKDEVYNATFTGFEYLAGLSRIIWHLSLVVLIFVLPWYYIRFYKIHEYIGLICYPVALVALTVLGFFVGLDRIERGLERLHLLLICWPLIQWKPDHIPCVHANPDDVRRTPQTKEWFGGGLGARIFGGENNPSLAISSISNRISVWTGRFDFPNSGASAPNPESGVLSELEPRNMPSLEPTEEPNDGTTIHETGHVSALPEETSALLSTPPATSNSSDFDKKEYDTIPQHRQSPPIHIRSQCSNSIASGSVDALLQC